MPRRPNPDTPIRGAVLLGQVAALLLMLEVACSRCDRRGRLRTSRLVAEHGAQMPLPELLRILSADCPRRIAGQWHDVCGAHFPGLVRVRL